jgi:primosomal protein N' (replication factor Y)
MIDFGRRVEVPLRNKLYSAIIIKEIEKPDSLVQLRSIRAVIDSKAVITEQQFTLWQWMAEYYMSTIGEVMNVALPSGLKLNSETKLISMQHIDDYRNELSDKEYLIAEAVSIQNELTISQVQEILDQKTVYPIIKSLLDKEILYIKEELKQKFKAKMEDYLRLTEVYRDKGDKLNDAFDKLTRSEKQTRALLSYIQLSRAQEWVSKKEIYKHAQVGSAEINAIVRKEIFQKESKEVSRISNERIGAKELPPLNPHQIVAIDEIREQQKENDHILLFGVTGSGKTRIYIDLIKEVIGQGKQVLYLLPEIALTTQIVDRLRSVFEGDIGVYHSKMSNNQRVELWNASLNGKQLILGARSSLFLPFQDLGLIIIDEEHDPSYKQADPAPRYNARDTAMYLAKLYKAKVLLGTATPSLSTYVNASNNKYGLVKLLERHGEAVLPEIKIVDLKEQYKKGLMRSLFSKELKDSVQAALDNNEQALIFQNRRGYSPTLQCNLCDFNAQCPNCDVSLTVHNYFEQIRCHYCGHRQKLPQECPACGNTDLQKLGFGTEKIEQEIKSVFPDAKVARLDFDTAKTKNAYQEILSDFKTGKTNILVGTQMITKGLDFENISVVGILVADKILFFPDYKANERAFQLFTQVAGRAGRRAKKGKVIIQTYNPDHPVIRETEQYNYIHFYQRELKERSHFLYPPFYRMIKITVKHKKPDVAEDTALLFTMRLKAKLNKRVIGPSVPGISRIRGFYQQQIIIKMERDITVIKQIKKFILDTKNEIIKIDGKKTVRIIIDVDP